MSTKMTTAAADSSYRSAAAKRVARRPGKAALLRIKIVAIAAAVGLFFASLAGIAVYNPGVGSQAAAPVAAQSITVVRPGGSRSLLLAPPPSVTAMRPLVRSRGS